MSGLLASVRRQLATTLPAGSLRARIAGGAFWFMLGSVASQGLAALTAILVARMLGESLFGELAMVQSTLSMFAVFAGLTLGQTASKHIAELRSTDPARAGRVLGMTVILAAVSGLFISAVVAAVAPMLARRALDAPHLAGCLRLSSPLLLFGAVTGVLSGALAGFEAFKRQSRWAVALAAVNCILTVAGARLAGVPGALLGITVGGLIVAFANVWIVASECRRFELPIAWRGAFAERQILWSFALPSLLTGVMVAPVSWVANAMLFKTVNGNAEMGIYNAANQWRNLLLYITSIVLGPLLPVMCNLHASREYARLKRLLQGSLLANLLIVGLPAVVLAIFAVWILRLYGPGFERGVTPMRIILAVSVLLAAGTVVGNLLISAGSMWLAFLLNALWGLTLILSSALLVPRLGATGLALSHLISYGIHTGAQMLYFFWRIRRLDTAQIPPHSTSPISTMTQASQGES